MEKAGQRASALTGFAARRVSGRARKSARTIAHDCCGKSGGRLRVSSAPMRSPCVGVAPMASSSVGKCGIVMRQTATVAAILGSPTTRPAPTAMPRTDRDGRCSRASEKTLVFQGRSAIKDRVGDVLCGRCVAHDRCSISQEADGIGRRRALLRARRMWRGCARRRHAYEKYRAMGGGGQERTPSAEPTGVKKTEQVRLGLSL